MAIRSSSRVGMATSGPGRGAGSDGRVRRRAARSASGEELRRRAEVLFGQGVGEPAASGGGVGGVGAFGGGSVLGAPAGGVDEVRGGGSPCSEGLLPPVRDRGGGRFGAALRERMPLWVQARCGLERRHVVALGVLLLVGVLFAVQHFWAGRTQPVRAPEVVRAAVAGGEERKGAGGSGASSGVVATPGAEIVVDVGGKVREPGVHRLPPGSRVADALRAAGGVRPGTNTEGLNRARFLVDGEQVIVGAAAAGSGAGADGSVPAPGGGAGVGAGGAAPGAPVALNTATVEQLDSLPGVGPVLAQHIVDYRTQHGGFRSVDELRQVNGIGDRRFADLKNLVRP
ncbi:helix-hairpin-helix domain-containing protein [Streptomyces sp. NPDC091279]|uniref:helix-hairpin-helix domain-containing protein n=1 Tax=Streptomyces sp. NPDC091279 TaxID=3365983 RepID=UPI0038096062